MNEHIIADRMWSGKLPCRSKFREKRLPCGSLKHWKISGRRVNRVCKFRIDKRFLCHNHTIGSSIQHIWNAALTCNMCLKHWNLSDKCCSLNVLRGSCWWQCSWRIWMNQWNTTNHFLLLLTIVLVSFHIGCRIGYFNTTLIAFDGE